MFSDSTPPNCGHPYPSTPFCQLAKATTFHFCNEQSLEEVMVAYNKTKCLMPNPILNLRKFRSFAANSLEASIGRAMGHPFFLAAVRLYFGHALACWGLP